MEKFAHSVQDWRKPLHTLVCVCILLSNMLGFLAVTPQAIQAAARPPLEKQNFTPETTAQDLGQQHAVESVALAQPAPVDILATAPIASLNAGQMMIANPAPSQSTLVDYGDEPDSYGTLIVSNGPSHGIAPILRLGAQIDGEADGQPTLSADGDDTTATPDDEDGVQFKTPLRPGSQAIVAIGTSQPLNTNAYLNAWVDFNQDGDFNDPGEQIATDSVILGNSLRTNVGNTTIAFNIPIGAVSGLTYARFRLCSAAGDCNAPTGAATDGEVEDYRVPIETVAKLGDYVWLDTNSNGVQDSGESGIPGLLVKVYRASDNILVGVMPTDANGLYSFPNLIPDTYYVEFLAPSGYIFTTPNQGADPAKNSDADQTTGRTSNITLAAGADDQTWDAGLIAPANQATYCESLPWGLTEISHTFSLPKFNPALGTLTGVSLNNYQGLRQWLGFENTSANDQIARLNSTSTGLLTLPNSTQNSSVGLDTGFRNITVYDGIADYTGSSSFAYSDWQYDFSAGSTNYTPVADFIAASPGQTIDLPFQTLSGLSTSGGGGNFLFQQKTYGLAGICVSYSYTPAPQPVTGTGVLTVTKTVIGTGSGPFTITVVGPNSYVTTTTIMPGTPVIFTGLANGIYTVTETNPGASWVTTYTVNSVSNATSGVVNLSNPLNVTPVTAAAISGTVFRDFNEDGQITANGVTTDTGMSGVAVTAFDPNGVACGSTTSDSTGEYSFTPTCSGPWRLVFSGLPAGYEPSSHGAQNDTSVQFIAKAPATNVNFAINHPCDYCQANPKLATTTYQNGDPLASGNTVKNKRGLVTWDYANSGTTPAATTQAVYSQIGSAWGLAYQRESKSLFVSAVVRRHSGLGPNGLGAIYKQDLNTGNTTLFVDVTALGVNVGTLPSNATRGLPLNTTSPSTDPDAFDAIGKVGIGGLSLSDDGKTLYFTNLNDRNIYGLAIGNPAVAPTSAKIYALPATACTNGVARPWALKYYHGTLYAGVVCTGESSTTNADLSAYVYAMTPAAGGFTSTPVLTFPLNYSKGCAEANAVWTPDVACQWNPWAASHSAVATEGNGEYSLPQPMLTDLEFDKDGSMILSFTDRYSMQAGYLNYTPTGSTESGILNGDLLRAYPVGVQQWQLESGGDKDGAGPFTPMANNTQLNNLGTGPGTVGPGGGEFYYADFLAPFHEELAIGALAYLPGAGEIAATIMDPLVVDTSGVRKFSNADGSEVSSYQIRTNANAEFGKSAGLGDLILLCDPAPIEIGNRVWNDVNGNGIQDPGEAGLSGVTVSLQGPTNTVTMNTDANGLYYFSNLVAHTAYTLTVTPPSDMNVTTANAAALDGATAVSNHAISDTIDSDAGLVSSEATLYYTTGNAGQNNHGLDFGFTRPVKGQADIVNQTPVKIGNRLWIESDQDGDATTGSVIPVVGQIVTATGSTGQVYTATTDVNGLYTITVPANAVYTVTTGTPVGTTMSTVITSVANDGNAAANNDKNHDQTGTQVMVNTTDNFSIDFGFHYPDVQIGNRLWIESDNDGDATTGTVTPIVGQIVTATNGTGQIYTATTDATGLYTITVPANDIYTVTTGTPTGTVPSTVITNVANDSNATANNDKNHAKTGTTVTVVTTDNFSVDFGFHPAPVSLGNLVWFDTNNNGQVDTGEYGVSSVKVDLYQDTNGDGSYTPGVDAFITTTNTSASGYYSFTDLTPSSSLSTRYLVVIAGTNFVNGGALYQYQNSTGSVGNSNTTNSQDNGVDGTLAAYGLGGYIASHAISLTPGSQPTDDGDTSTSNPLTAAVDVTDNLPNPSNTNWTLDFGFYQLTLGNQLWYDKNNNGLYEPVSNGEAGLAGITVTLLSNGTPVLTTTTDATGVYTFTGLISGTYQVQINGPAGLISTQDTVNSSAVDNIDNNDKGPGAPSGVITSQPFQLMPGNQSGAVTVNNPAGVTVNPTLDFGLIQLVKLGNRLWIESDNDGDATTGNISPVVGQVVTVTNSSGVVYTTTTDSNGLYTMTVPANDTYTVTTGTPAGTVPGKIMTSVANDSNAAANDDKNHNYTGTTVTVVTTDNLSVDFGFHAPFAQFGDRVWLESDTDGLASTGVITPIASMMITATDGSGMAYTTATNRDGYYSFTLPVGTYTVTYGSVPASYGAVTPSSTPGGNSENGNAGAYEASGNPDQSHVNGTTVTVTDGQANWHIDFAFHNLVQIGNRLWIENDTDGDATTGTVTPVIGQVVTATNNSGTVYTATTDAGGLYTITVPANAVYTVTTGIPAGTVWSQYTGTPGDNQSHTPTGTSVTVGATNDYTIDFGFHAPLAQFGDRVWIESDTDGSANTGALTAIAGLTITATSSTGQVYTMQTNANGYYSFTVLAGTYTVTYGSVPASYATVTPSSTPGGNTETGNAGAYQASGNLDQSHANNTTVTVSDGQANWHVDFAFTPVLVKIGNRLWIESDNDGDATTGTVSPVSGQVVTATNSSGTIYTTTTDSQGLYTLTVPADGVYTVTTGTPVGTVPSTIITNVANDGNAATNNDKNHNQPGTTVTVVTTDNLSVDFGFHVPLVQFGDRVWLESDTDGLASTGVITPVAGLLITATDGTHVYTTTTNVAGYYSFTVAAGTYTVSYGKVPASYGVVVPSATPGGSSESGIAGIYQETGNPDQGHANGMTVTVADGETNWYVDFAFHTPLAQFGDRVWLESDTDGNANTGTIAPVAGLIITATDGTHTYTTTTNAAGYYSFTVLAGRYGVTYGSVPTSYGAVTPSSTPGGNSENGNAGVYEETGNLDQSHTNGTTVTVADGEANWHVDFAFTPVLVRIGNRLWIENDTDGDATTGTVTPVVGQVVTATNSSGTVYTATTDANGLYTITVPANDVYTVTTGTPVGTVPSLYNGTPGDNQSHTPTGTPVTVATTDNLTLDFGFHAPLAQFGDRVWIESDTDGNANTGSITPVTGIVITATNGANIYTTTTNVNGYYSFTVPAGTYTITYGSVPTSYGTVVPSSTPGGNSESSNAGLYAETGNPDQNHTNGVTVTVAAGEANWHVDFAFNAPLVEIGNRLWIEDDTDGDATTGHVTPVVGQVVTATSSSGIVYTTTTDVDGLYTITVPANNTYTVTTDTPAGTIPSVYNGTPGDNQSHVPTGTVVSVGMTDDFTIDFGFHAPRAQFGDRVWLESDTDGEANTGSITPIAGLTITATDGTKTYTTTTNANGYYSFTVPAGTYTVSYGAVPNSYGIVVPSDTPGGNSETGNAGSYTENGAPDQSHQNYTSVTLVDGQANWHVDFAFNQPPTPTATPTNTPVPPTATPTNTPVPPTATPTNTSVPPTATTTNTLVPPTATPTETPTNTPVPPTATPTNTSVPPTATTTNTLVPPTATPTETPTNTPVPPTATPTNTPVPPTATTTNTLVPPTATPTNTPVPPTAKPTNTSVPPTATLANVAVMSYSLGNRLWIDDGAGNAANSNNGQVDPNEQPVQSGVFVELLNGNGNPVLVNGQLATTTTDANGYYRFDNLPAGQYQVRVTANNFVAGGKLSGYVSSNGQNTDFSSAGNNHDHGDNPLNPASDGVKSVVITLGTNNPTGEMDNNATGNGSNGPSGDTNDNLTADFGFFATASIGDYVWLDKNVNGVQDAGEPAVAGVQVALFKADGSPAIDVNGNAVAPQATDATGTYRFANLLPGDYYVQFTPPANYFISTQDQGADDTVDSDVNPTTGKTVVTTLVSGENDTTWDLGLYQGAAIGNYVWDDKNGNGLQEIGEPGLPAVTVTLYDNTGNPVATTQTDVHGIYGFSGLTPGDYSVQFTTPGGYVPTHPNQSSDDTIDSDAVDGHTAVTTLTNGEHDPTWDAGFTLPASIHSYVWNDGTKETADGIKEPNEPGVPNVTVILLNGSGQEITRTTTDKDGLFEFNNLVPDDYKIKFVTPEGTEFTKEVPDVLENSDANPTTGETVVKTLQPGQTDTSWNAGIVTVPTALDTAPEPNAASTHIYLPVVQNQTQAAQGRSGFKNLNAPPQQTLDQIVEEYWDNLLLWVDYLTSKK